MRISPRKNVVSISNFILARGWFGKTARGVATRRTGSARGPRILIYSFRGLKIDLDPAPTPENIDSNISDFFPLFSNGWNFLGFRLKSACLDGSQGIAPAFTDPKKGPRKCTRPSPSRHPQRVAFFVPRPSRARTWTVPTYSLSLDEIIYIIFCR